MRRTRSISAFASRYLLTLLNAGALACSAQTLPEYENGNPAPGGNPTGSAGESSGVSSGSVDDTPSVDNVAPSDDSTSDLNAECESTILKSQTILEQNCASCHGPGAAVAGFESVLDVDQLLASGKVIAGDAQASPLYRRISSGEMPPAAQTQRPSEDDVAVLEDWITKCLVLDLATASAGGSEPCDENYVPMSNMLSWMASDMLSFEADDRRFIRYFTLTHLHNSGVCGAELDTYRMALSKAVNALSLGTRIVAPKAIDDLRTIYRIDLRDYDWDSTITGQDKWEELVDANPYAIEYLEDDAELLKLFANTRVPFQAGDWFVNTATQPPLYHTMLNIPETLGELEQQLGIDIGADIANEEVWRSGFLNSGVSAQNRVIERHDIPVASTRSLWISYDFARNGGLENIFSNPLDFEADGSEIIFTLPNGLHAYMVVNAAGIRLDAAPDNIVTDPQQEDNNVHNGISCMSCHESGTKLKADEVREFVESSASFGFETKRAVAALYPPVDEFRALIDSDSQLFSGALASLGIPAGMSTEPIILTFNAFDQNVDLSRAAAELGIPSNTLLRELGGLSDELESLSSGTVKRGVFRAHFAAVVCALNIGLADDPACDAAVPSDDPETDPATDPETDPATDPETDPTLDAGTSGSDRTPWTRH